MPNRRKGHRTHTDKITASDPITKRVSVEGRSASSIEGARDKGVRGLPIQTPGHLGVGLKILLHPEPEAGGYSVEVPALAGCFTQGDTLEEALANARDAIASWLEAAQEVNPGEPALSAVVVEIPL